ncbi:hypothetical protein [Tichowtungia aerotolerans]|uniref:Uncharacterized protein n=1 Tax=Tichowtungia aerotolerans TaxID=2697043 RepID=A0A6P1M7D5_9BACT|nr:hypothetical protein [Tichowtungia aerotolerans]QHI70500.1 hypothetical protein GT409_13975 [Tichowtungia aerotolerans]
MFNIGEKDSDGRQKRIEHRGRHLRISRTGGVAVREQIKVAGLNLTANSKHGVRATTRIAKGTNAGFQNGNFRLRGRYGKGPTKLNLSKSGISASTKTAIGTFNWMKPNRSSVKIGGVQIRGKNAATIQMVYAVFALAAFAVQAAVVIIVFLAQMLWVAIQALTLFLCWLLPILWDGCVSLGEGSVAAVHGHKRAKLMPVAETLAGDPKISGMTLPELEMALENIITAGGRGNPLNPPLDQMLDAIDAETAADRVRILLLAVATAHREQAEESALVPLYLRIDDQCVQDGGRTRLQELLLEDYAALNRLKLKSE